MAPREVEQRAGRRHLWPETLLVLACSVATLLKLSQGLGLTWDESIYFKFADSVARWFSEGPDFSQNAVARAWAYDPFLNTHPELFRVLDAIGAALTSRFLSFPLNYRFAHLFYMSACLALIYRLIRSRTSRAEALAAIGFVTLVPRSLGDLLLANSDSPVMISWLTAVVVAWRLDEETEPRRLRMWRALLVVFCALAGAGKVTGVLLLPPLAVYFLLRRKHRELLTVSVGALCAVTLPILVSPEKWRQPLDALMTYLIYPVVRGGIPISTTYLGRVYISDLPWHYFLVMSAVTFPLIGWLCLCGLAIGTKAWRSLAQALGLSVAMWTVVGLNPSTPRHDGVRQFVSVYPLLGLLAWIGFMTFLNRLEGEHPALLRRGSWLFPLSVPLLLAFTVARTHPYELSYYNPIVGGIQGAEGLGMEATYYFDALTEPTLRALQENVRPGETLAMSPFWPPLFESYREHTARPLDFKVVKAGDPTDWLLLYRRRNTVDDRVYLKLPAVHEVKYDGVSLLKLVRRTDIPPGLGDPISAPR